MNELDELQSFIAAQLRSRRALPKSAQLVAQAARVIKAHGALSPVERLEIYREQFWLRHTSSLVEDFPGVSGILGQRAWASLIEGYLDAHPPTGFTLRDLGLCLPEYIDEQSELEHRELCRDMARLERGYIEIFDAADALPIAAESLAAVPEAAWEHARLVIHPALRLLQLKYPVAALRRRLIEAKSSAETVALPQASPHCLLLFRRDLQMFHEPISAGAHALLAGLARGVPLVLACEQAQTEVPAEADAISQNIGAWFQSWAARGFVTAVEL